MLFNFSYLFFYYHFNVLFFFLCVCVFLFLLVIPYLNNSVPPLFVSKVVSCVVKDKR